MRLVLLGCIMVASSRERTTLMKSCNIVSMECRDHRADQKKKTIYNRFLDSYRAASWCILKGVVDSEIKNPMAWKKNTSDRQTEPSNSSTIAT